MKDTVSCILCKAVISFEQRDKKKYVQHMRRDHGAFDNINLILVINLLEKEILLKLIKNIYGEKYDRKLLGKEVMDSREASVQTEPVGVDAEVQTEYDDRILNDLQHFVTDLQRISLQMKDDQSLEETDLSFSSEIPDEDLQIPSDVELDEALCPSTPNSSKVLKIKEEKIDYFIPPDETLDPIEVLLDDEDFNILDVTNEDLVLTPAGPMPISDYSNFIPEAVIPPQYNPNEGIQSQNEDEFNDSTESTQGKRRKKDSEMEVSHSPREKDLVCLYLKEESHYFKTKNEISTSSKDRAEKFTETDQSLPAGWRWRTFVRKNGRVDYEYLSPELKVLRSRVGVVEYMKAMGGYSEEEMTRVLPVRIKKEKV